jgi:DnaK suppressor protein
MAEDPAATDAANARAALAARLAELETRAGHVHSAAAEPVSADSEEAATEKQDDDALAAEEALIARERAALAAALARIDAGDWGDCTRCGEPIDPRRLAAQPEAALCISCATDLGG